MITPGAWPLKSLAEVLTPVPRAETVEPDKDYPLLGIRLDGGGPFLRETVAGVQTAAKTLYRVATGDFIYSRLFACRGAFGVIDHLLHDHFVSAEFPTFQAVAGAIDVHFLRYCFRLPEVLRRVDALCSGSTPLTRNRLI
jgi:type I restriction enzyme S subunit